MGKIELVVIACLIVIVFLLIGFAVTHEDTRFEFAGSVVDVSSSQEDSGYTTLIVRFSDGRILKCRSKWNQQILFNRQRPVVIVTDSCGTIVNVKYVNAEEE